MARNTQDQVLVFFFIMLITFCTGSITLLCTNIFIFVNLMWCYYISFDRVCAPLQYTFPSVLDNCKMTFHTNKGHVFYKKQCADSNLYQTKQTGKSCFVPPGRKQSHNHDKVSREILEYEIICWGCLLRILNGRGEETVNQSVKICRVDMAPQTLHSRHY